MHNLQMIRACLNLLVYLRGSGCGIISEFQIFRGHWHLASAESEKTSHFGWRAGDKRVERCVKLNSPIAYAVMWLVNPTADPHW